MPRQRLTTTPSVSARLRSRIRRELAARTPLLEHLTRQVTACSKGPDPEASLVFAWMLAQELRLLLALLRPPR